MRLIVGLDEVGRGAWAGPVVSAAVVFKQNQMIDGITDSKLLSYQKRQQLAITIKEQALAIGIGWVNHEVIDQYGLTRAVQKSMEYAISQLEVENAQIIIDGNHNFLEMLYPQARAIIKADLKYPCVAAASIIAKVSRDLYMQQMSKLYPAYGFELHVGYGTAKHKESINQNGPCQIHRKSYKPLRKRRFIQSYPV